MLSDIIRTTTLLIKLYGNYQNDIRCYYNTVDILLLLLGRPSFICWEGAAGTAPM